MGPRLNVIMMVIFLKIVWKCLLRFQSSLTAAIVKVLSLSFFLVNTGFGITKINYNSQLQTNIYYRSVPQIASVFMSGVKSTVC